MDTALMVVGLISLGVLFAWMFASTSDPKEIDETEEAQVRAETPQDIERERFREAAQNAENNEQDIAFYSPGEGLGEHNSE